MATIDLNLVRHFVAVNESGSFSAAASQLRVPRSTVSRAIAALEDRLGLPLFTRTTRRVTVTAEGEALYARLAPSLGSLEVALADLPERQEEPSGLLRVTATADLGTVVLAEIVTRYVARYPRVEVDMRLTTNVVDLAKEGCDIALRASSRRLGDSTLVASRVGTLTVRAYASPVYLARRKAPRSQGELAEHTFIGMRKEMPLARAPGNVRARVVVDDMFVARELARRGAGIATLPTFLGDPDVAEGTLVRVLPGWAVLSGGVYVVTPHRRHVPARVGLFREMVKESLRQRPV
jgi:DNA-binding transcriptional LysR family regulator